VGIVVGVVTPQGRRVISYGALDQKDRRLPDGDTIFEIGSVTKVFTSLLLADMVQRGEVALGDPVQKYLPAGVRMPQWKGRSIALVDLATHTSGLPFWPWDFPLIEDVPAYSQYTVERLYGFLSTHELPREPGTRWEYSNTGGGLLGLALGLRVGMDDIVRHVLRPSMPLDKPPILTVRRETAVDARLLDLYGRQYRPSSEWVYTVTHERGALRIQLPAAPKMRLYAETQRDFFLKDTDAQVTFGTDDNGHVTGLVLHIWGMNVPAVRIGEK
jgi:serine-type D-Ala-D-Ala carboxypeptidase/endopeptidase